MKRVLPGIAAALLLGLSPTSDAAPKKKGSKDSTTKNQPSSKHKPSPTPSGQRLDASGVVTGMLIGNAGEILSMTLRVSGSTRTQHVKGCGAKIAEQTLLQWAFIEGRLVHMSIASDECFMNVLISPP